jgi:hypothetical protein
MKQLARMKGSTLEVGSGAVGIGLLADRPFVGCDLKFERQPAPQMSAVMGSALHLPFADGEFEVVVASDVLEHIPPNSRAAVVDQLIRVGRRWILMGVPCGPSAARSDGWLARWLAFRGKSDPDWLVEHRMFGLPSCEGVDDLLKRRREVTWTVFPNENIWTHLLFMILDGTRVGAKVNRSVWQCCPRLLAYVADAGCWGPWYRRIYVVERADE